MRETVFKSAFLSQVQIVFPDAEIVTNTGCGIQGYPDTTITYRGRRAHLEFKNSWNAKVQPNQQWYITDLDKKEFARFVYPENSKEVMEELHGYLTGGSEAACLSGGQQLSLAELAG